MSKVLLTFVIPVRHPDNARDWNALCAKLTQTTASIARQSDPDWRGVVVANEGAELPELPRGFNIVRVNFPANAKYELGQLDREEFYDAVRADKGMRLLTGMLAAKETKYFMVVDDDDFVSSRIVMHIRENEGEHGWVVERGYLWTDGGKLLLCHDQFDKLCGTSLIVRSDLYALPASFEEASLEWIKKWLGSHIFLRDLLTERRTPLVCLPFRGAVYRVGHAGSHSQARSILRAFFFNKSALRRPRNFVRNLFKLRWLTHSVTEEFFGR